MSGYSDFASRQQAQLEAEPENPEQRSERRRRERWTASERSGIPVDQRYRLEGVERRLRKALGRQPTIGEVKAALGLEVAA